MKKTPICVDNRVKLAVCLQGVRQAKKEMTNVLLSLIYTPFGNLGMSVILDPAV